MCRAWSTASNQHLQTGRRHLERAIRRQTRKTDPQNPLGAGRRGHRLHRQAARRSVVNPSQIRHIIRTYRDKLPEIFPGRQHVPKTLIFAKTDSHADDIIRMVRQEFGEGNDFCKKVTYKTDEDPKSVLSRFRTRYNPRIAVTVDMIATGTDVKALECLIFMRDVKSRNYYEQMKGRGTRTISRDDLLQVTPDAVNPKSHYVLVDAVGVTQTLKTDSRPLERKPGVALKDLLAPVLMGAQDEDLYTSLAGRLLRLDKQLSDDEKAHIESMTGGLDLNELAGQLLHAYNPDTIEDRARAQFNLPPTAEPDPAQLDEAQQALLDEAAEPFSGALNEYIETVRQLHDQIIDTVNLDTVEFAGWDSHAAARAGRL